MPRHQRTRSLARLVLVFAALASTQAFAQSESTHEQLTALEEQSHQWWWQGDRAALDRLMHSEYRFVAPNGARETKSMILGLEPGAPKVLDVTDLRMEVEEVVMQKNHAVVTGVLHMKATVFGRPAPERLRVLSIYSRTTPNAPWKLTARSTTPVRSPPPTGVAPNE